MKRICTHRKKQQKLREASSKGGPAAHVFVILPHLFGSHYDMDFTPYNVFQLLKRLRIMDVFCYYAARDFLKRKTWF